MKHLFLEDLASQSEEEIRNHFVGEYEAVRDEVDKYEILIAYESVGSWGCDSSSFFLLRDKKTKALFTVHGSHCSCYGFEGQFTPEPVTVKYLKSDKFYLSTGGYDDHSQANEEAVKEFVGRLK